MPTRNANGVPNSAAGHRLEHCPSCGQPFECRLDDPLHCQCAAVRLSADQVKGLLTRYTGCLCADCLRKVAR